MNESVRKIWRRQWRQYLIVCVCFTLHLPLPLFPAFPNFYCCCNFATAASSFDEMCTGEICVYFGCFGCCCCWHTCTEHRTHIQTHNWRRHDLCRLQKAQLACDCSFPSSSSISRTGCCICSSSQLFQLFVHSARILRFEYLSVCCIDNQTTVSSGGIGSGGK